MNTQNQIKRTLSTSQNIEYIQNLLDSNEFANRSKVADAVCEYFGFHDARGQKQLTGCLKALKGLEAAGHFLLPKSVNGSRNNSPRRLSEPVPAPLNVPDKVEDIKGLALILVSGSEHMLIWNEMMISEHPQGAGPLVGRQLRYLIHSDHGWLGGVAFSSSALQLSDRDEWIGWDAEQRRAHLHRVVGMSRFLIRPSVRCVNLASKALSMSIAALPADFKRHYGYRPYLIESFVDTDYYLGTCYRAANWIEVGKTKGRGRQDRFHKQALSSKAIYVYPINKDFRRQIGLSSDAGLGALSPDQGLKTEHWAQNEFGGARLGDLRLSKRLVSLAEEKAQHPDLTFNGVAKGDWAKAKAYYRMIEQPEESMVTMVNILEPHRNRTIRRMMGQKTVLCVQDGSDLNYNNVARCEGLGEIGTNQTGVKSRGLKLHSTLAVATDGLPLGIVHAQCLAPEKKAETRPSHAVPIEEKKNFVWIEHHRDLVDLSARLPQTRLVHVCDREADFFEIFDEQRQTPCVDLLVRAKYNRNLPEEPFKLFSAVHQSPVLSRINVHVPRQSARPKRSKQKARPARPGRRADMAVRSIRVEIPATQYNRDKQPIELWIVHCLEEKPPENTKPIEWFLLTTVKIRSAVDAEQCLRWYVLRWRIEDWHRVLKSGCRIEDLAHATALRLSRAIAINLVIAWRIMLMTLLKRETPELPAEVLFSDIELKVLTAYAKKST